jgi:glycosyltransferase involved in cell wall biosynthesis
MTSIHHQTHPDNHRISVSIITKNRPLDMFSCLQSLLDQKTHPHELIIVDSSTDSETKKIVHAYSRTVQYPVIYIYEPRPGFPIARNHVIRKATNSWVAFTDDDCIADPDWISTIKSSIQKYPNAAAIAGESKSFYPNNIVSHAATCNESYWKSKARDGNNIFDLETLDNKNVAYNLSFFKQHKIEYDENRTAFFGASDDCDLGMQIQSKHGEGYYEKSMIVFHKDLIDLTSYTKRLIVRSFAHATYENKWHIYRNTLKSKHIRFRSFFIQYVRTNNLNAYRSFLLLSILLYTFAFSKMLHIYISFKMRHTSL